MLLLATPAFTTPACLPFNLMCGTTVSIESCTCGPDLRYMTESSLTSRQLALGCEGIINFIIHRCVTIFCAKTDKTIKSCHIPTIANVAQGLA